MSNYYFDEMARKVESAAIVVMALVFAGLVIFVAGVIDEKSGESLGNERTMGAEIVRVSGN